MSDDSSSSGSASESEDPTPVKQPVKKRQKVEKTGPKKPLSSYMFYCKHSRTSIKEDNPEATFGQIGKLLGNTWKSMSKADKKKYEDMAAEDKERYKEEGGVLGRGAKAKSKNTGPKRPLSAYLYFSQVRRPELQSENPELKFAELGRLVGQAWKDCDADDRKVYDSKAAEDKIRYKNEMANVEKKAAVAAPAEESEEASSGDDSESESS